MNTVKRAEYEELLFNSRESADITEARRILKSTEHSNDNDKLSDLDDMLYYTINRIGNIIDDIKKQ